MNTAAKGSRNERRSMAFLEAAGYRCTRSAGSLGAWDVIGIGTADVVLVQTKSGRWPSRAEMQTLEAFEVPPNVRKVIHRWRAYRRLPDVREV